jgi:hypothetical protein
MTYTATVALLLARLALQNKAYYATSRKLDEPATAEYSTPGTDTHARNTTIGTNVAGGWVTMKGVIYTHD